MLSILVEELQAARATLGAADEIPGTGCYTNNEELDVVVAKAPDRGNAAAIGITRDLLENFRPELLVVTGIAGGIKGREDVEPGDVVAVDYVHYAEFRKIIEGKDLRRYIPYDQPTVPVRQQHVEPAAFADDWKQGLALQPPEPREPKVLIGSVVAVDKVTGDPDHEAHKYVVDTYDNAVAVDMESFGVARAVHEARASVDYNPRLAIIRGISDHVAQTAEDVTDNNAQRQLWKEFAAAAAAAFTAEVVRRFLAVADPRAAIRGGT